MSFESYTTTLEISAIRLASSSGISAYLKLRNLKFEITYNNFEISLVVFMPKITTNHAITYTNSLILLSLWLR